MAFIDSVRFPGLLLFMAVGATLADSPVGYYRQPALHGETLVFVAEGDLWKISAEGGVATRLTSHPGDESQPAMSPDGRTLAFVARYEGPTELYTMPLAGGLPTRRTYGSGSVSVSGWTPDGRILYSTDLHSTLPNWQLLTLDIADAEISGVSRLLPLAQAADGWYSDDGRTLFFTRLRFQGSRTKRYKGGTAQNIWSFSEGDTEAVPLTPDYAGTSKRPMYWRGRIYFASDRDGTMNLWSMTPDGGDLRQHTRHVGWDVSSPNLHEGRIAYQLGADLRVYDVAQGHDRPVPVTLDSDLDQMRENWIEKPMDYLTSAHVSPDGDRVVLTARGRVFVAPHRQGRLVEATRNEGVRYRDARFMPDGQGLLALSDESGEVELWHLPANGVGSGEQLTHDGEVLRWEGFPSPDGERIAHHDKNQRLYLYDVKQKTDRLIDENAIGDFFDLAWSPDGKWLAYGTSAGNLFSRIKLYGVESGESTPVTSDRFGSYDPAWSPDGKWLYLLSDRDLSSIVGSPWGNYQPEPYLDKTTRIYHLALQKGLRSPFAPRDELHEEEEGKEEEKEGKGDEKNNDKKGKKKDKSEEPPVKVEIDFEGIEARLQVTPVSPGNYSGLQVTEDAMFWISRRASEPERSLSGVAIVRDDLEVKTVVADIRGYEISADGKKLLVRKKDDLYIIDAKPEEGRPGQEEGQPLPLEALGRAAQEEWRQMFVEAWRLERDYFYDKRHARRRLEGDARQVPAAGRPRDDPAELVGPDRPDGRRAERAAHLRRRR